MKNMTALFCLFAALVATSSVNANRVEPTEVRSLINESFELGFPPEGWTLDTANPEDTWGLATEVYEALAEKGEYFTLVEGTASGASNELLITPEVEPSGCDSIHLTFQVIGPEESEPGLNERLEILLRETYSEQWIVLDEIEPNRLLDPDGWYETGVTDIAVEGRFQLGFRYLSNNGRPFGIDSVQLIGIVNPDGNDAEACGCGPSKYPTLAMAAVMMLIGLSALAVGRKN
jgi:hypothetical protein